MSEMDIKTEEGDATENIKTEDAKIDEADAESEAMETVVDPADPPPSQAADEEPDAAQNEKAISQQNEKAEEEPHAAAQNDETISQQNEKVEEEPDAAAQNEKAIPEINEKTTPAQNVEAVEVNEAILNTLNEPDNNNLDTESKAKHRRYWTPKEEERFCEIWGRENWRLTKHGKNTIFFAKWSEELKERYNFDVKPEEVQCKVNQIRAKYRQVKRSLESGDRTAITWKKYDLVEKILKNQYRSKDDEPVPLEALENNRDMSPTELLNRVTEPPSPSDAMSNTEGINLNQATVDHQLTDNVSLSEHNLTSNVFSNNSQSSNSFSTELFGVDQLDIKQEMDIDIKQENFSEFMPLSTSELTNPDAPTTMDSQEMLGPNAFPENANNLDINQNSSLLSNRLSLQNHASNNGDNLAVGNHTQNNHVTKTMQPPKPSPRKRNRNPSASAAAAAAATSSALVSTQPSQDNLEMLYLEEIKRKNVILVEQGEINRKRLRLEERKVKLLEDFFPKFLTLQQEMLKKLDNVTAATPEAINIRIEE